MYNDNTQTNYRHDLKQKILRNSMREFLNKGVRSVKMDDIAKKLGISKRTLYEIYSNKEELLLECVRLHEEEYDKHISAYASEGGHNVIDIIIEFYKCKIGNLSDVTPQFFQQLCKYDNVMHFLESKQDEREKHALSFFQQGVREGFFRSDVDFQIVMRMGTASMEMLANDKSYGTYTLRYVLHNVIFIIIRGLCTEQGIKKLDAFLKEGN